MQVFSNPAALLFLRLSGRPGCPSHVPELSPEMDKAGCAPWPELQSTAQTASAWAGPQRVVKSQVVRVWKSSACIALSHVWPRRDSSQDTFWCWGGQMEPGGRVNAG